MSSNPTDALAPLNIALLTVSDTRGPDEDTSGQYLEDQLLAAVHQFAPRRPLPGDVYLVRALLSRGLRSPPFTVSLSPAAPAFRSGTAHRRR